MNFRRKTNKLKIKFNKLLSLILILCISTLTFSSCNFNKFIEEQYHGNSEENEETSLEKEPVTQMTIGFDSSDGLNPLTYKKEINHYIIPLIFDSLITVDSNFMAMPSLAQSVEVSANTCTIKLKDNIVFSDGAKLTAADVEYSINKLKSSSNVYSQKLTNIISVSKKGDTTILLNLNRADSMFSYNLDFPIFKKDTGENQTPVGSGRYVYEKDGSSWWLSLNKNNTQSTLIPINKIVLSPLPDNDAVLYSVKSGAIDYSFAKAASTSGYSSATGYSHCKTNNLIFLGTNNTSGIMNQTSVRQSVFSALKRNLLCSQGFAGFASGAFFPFNPFYGEYIKTSFNTSSYNEQNAISLLESSGYLFSKTDDSKYRYKDGKRLEIKLIVNTENSYKILTARMIKKQLEEVGFFVNIEEVDFETLKSKIPGNDYDIYIGEITISQNMELSSFFENNSIIKNGTDYGELYNLYNGFKASSQDLDKFLNEFYNQMPFIPLMFTRDIVIYSRNIDFNIDPGLSDIFNNMDKWKKTAEISSVLP
ncbi:MAG: ABC transporter substrate-binding protein [Oscillospiraceae bacterium]